LIFRHPNGIILSISFYLVPAEKEVFPLAISVLLAYSAFAGLAFCVDSKRF